MIYGLTDSASHLDAFGEDEAIPVMVRASQTIVDATPKSFLDGALLDILADDVDGRWH